MENYSIYVNVKRNRVLYGRPHGQPAIERGVAIQVWRAGKCLVSEVRNVADEAEAQRWEALQDRLAAERPAF
jgi:hypothetical protein